MPHPRLGGTQGIWRDFKPEVQVTLLNLFAAESAAEQDGCGFSFVPGDACAAGPVTYGYDVVFSNSVLEHVGSRRRQQQFAEAVRSGRSYWVQVPAPAFPLEVHCRLPFWWLLPPTIRMRLIRRWWRGRRPFLGRQMAGTRPITRRRLRELFPDGSLATERWMGLPKSYYIYRPGPQAAARIT